MNKNSGKYGKHCRAESTGNIYFHRPTMGKSSETRARQLAGNVYGSSTNGSGGKKSSGVPVSPLRTIRSPVP